MNPVKVISEPQVSWVNAAAVAAVLSNSRAPATARHVLLVLATHANAAGTAWPSIGRLAALTGLAARTVTRALKTLEALGEITVLRQGGKNGTNLYRIEVLVKARRGGLEGEGGDALSPEAEAPAPVVLTQRGDNASGEGDALSPEQIREKSRGKTPSPFPSPKGLTGAEKIKTHPPAQEEEEEVSSNRKSKGGVSIPRSLTPDLPEAVRIKAERVLDVLGELSGQLELLFDNPRRLALWLATALYPELERLGEATFRAALEHYLPQAAGEGIRYPGRFLVTMLKRENPPPLVVRPGPGIEPEALLDEDPAGEGGEEAPGPDNPFAQYLRCSFGDHPRSADCCVPGALRAYTRAREALAEYPNLSPDERAGFARDLERARRRLEAAGEEELREAEALTGLRFEVSVVGGLSEEASRPVPTES